MNNEQQQIIDKVYESALMEYGWESLPSTPEGWFETIEHFIHKCKMDNEFYEKWGLKIEERELDRLERIYLGVNSGLKLKGITSNFEHEGLEELNIPTKLITVTYKEQTIESYE